MKNQTTKLPLPPGPKWHDAFTTNLSPSEYIVNLQRKFGDVVRFRGLFFPVYMLTNPEYVKEILTKSWPEFTKRTLDYKIVSSVLGNGLVTNDGEFWKKQRRLMQPVFSHKSMNQFAPVISSLASDMVNEWKTYESGKVVWLDQEMSRVTFKVVSRTLFGTNIDHVADEMIEILELTNQNPFRIKSLFRLTPNLPLPGNRTFKRVKARLNEIVDTLVAERKGIENGNDIVDRLIAARGMDSEGNMSDVQIRDEIITLMLAGHETSATALSWTFYLLSKNRKVEQQLREEIKEKLKGENPTHKTIQDLPYLKQVVQEAMRLYPPVPAFARKSEEETSFAGFRIPADSYIAISIYALHRHPDFWRNPEEFNPDRFISSEAHSRHSYSFLPFSAGPRACIGAGMAMLEIQLILAALIQRFTVTPLENHPVEALQVVTLKQKYGLPATIKEI